MKIKKITRKVTLIVLAIAVNSCLIGQYLSAYYRKEVSLVPKLFEPEKVSLKGRFEYGLSISPDGNELLFGTLEKDDFEGRIFQSKKVNGKWTVPSEFKPLAGRSVYLPFYTPDGKSLLFTQSKSLKNTGITDIWIMDKTKKGWASPEKVDSPVSSYTREGSVCMTMDRTLFFTSSRNHENDSTWADIYSALNYNGKYDSVEKIEELSSPSDEESVYVSPDKKYAILRTYVNDTTATDLFISFKTKSGKWGRPKRLNNEINTKDWEQRPFVTFDGKYLFFTRMVQDVNGVVESDIYFVDMKSVFEENLGKAERPN